MVKIWEVMKSKLFWLKIAELVMSIFIIGLVADYSPVSHSVNGQAVVYGTVVGFIMINIIVILAAILESPLSRIMMLIINPFAGLLFMISGGVLIYYWDNVNSYSDRPLGSGILALFNGVIYFIDFVLTFLRFS